MFWIKSVDEPQIIEHQMQQYKLFPLLAAAYAYWITGTKMRDSYFEMENDILEGKTDFLQEVGWCSPMPMV